MSLKTRALTGNVTAKMMSISLYYTTKMDFLHDNRNDQKYVVASSHNKSIANDWQSQSNPFEIMNCFNP